MKLYQHKVQYYETDQMGITHHSNYIRWMEEARIDFLNQLGYDFKTLEEIGMISPVTAIECHYRKSTTFSDMIFIDVWVEEFRGVKLKIRYEMKNEDGLLVCDGISEHCFQNKEGKIISVKRENKDLYDALTSMIR